MAKTSKKRSGTKSSRTQKMSTRKKWKKKARPQKTGTQKTRIKTYRANSLFKRIRDPIHDLIVFDTNDDIDAVAWRLLDCAEFQRLRRIRQLGFSEFVYPGATHTRFSHCIGVFHTARKILKVIRDLRSNNRYDKNRAMVSLCAALLHDVGHGPFSHVFEGVSKDLGRKKSHETWTSEIVTQDTQIRKVLASVDKSLPKSVADLIAAEDPVDIYSAIVSSQFDADRLDYLLRDRYMCGVSVGRFDFEWLLANLEIHDVSPVVEGGTAVGETIPWLVLNSKASDAAEGYLLARYQLYSTIYYHKTTRAAERMLGILLRNVARRLENGSPEKIGLSKKNPVVQFLGNRAPNLNSYLQIDDMEVWAFLSEATECKDSSISELANRLRKRALFKPFDISTRSDPTTSTGQDFLTALIADAKKLNLVPGETLIEDRPRQTGYDWYDWNSPSSLKLVLIRDKEHSTNKDIGGASPIVKALNVKTFIRVFVPDSDARDRVEKFWRKWNQR